MAELVAAESHTEPSGDNGAGAPGDAPPARQYNDAQVNAIAAKHKREGEKLGRKALLDTYGIESEEEFAKLLEVSRASAPKKQTDVDRVTEKLQAEAQKREAALTAQLEKLQAERDASLLRETAKGILANAGLVEGAADLVLAALGVGAAPEHKLVVKDGAVTVVDRDGDAVGTSPDKFVLEFIKTRTYLQSPTSQPASGSRKPNGAPKPTGPSRRLSFQEELDELVRTGMASHNGR